MAGYPLISRILGPGFTLALSSLLLLASVLLSLAAENDELFGDYYLALILLNVVGIILLAILTAFQIWRLIGQFRSQVLGSRLTLRFVSTFAVLALIPLAVVYYFAVQFLSRGVDSWFDVQIEQALDDALLLGRSSLASIKLDIVEQLRQDAQRIEDTSSTFEVIRLLDQLRESGNFDEMSLHTMSGKILASSSSNPVSLVPDVPDERVIRQVRQGQVYAELEPVGGGGLQLRAALQVHGRQVGDPARVLQVLFPLPLRYARLGERVESASAEYEKLQYLRQPLTFSFVLTLSLVTVMTLLIALWAAIYLAKRLVAPLRDLAEGTRAVAQGDYRKQLPVNSSDELGVLVDSFNRMTREISIAQNEVRNSQLAAENQHAYLETVLAHLSSGVMSFDTDARLHTHNTAAERILGTPLQLYVGILARDIGLSVPTTAPLLAAIQRGIDNDSPEWQDEISVTSALGRQTLVCSGTKLPGTESTSGWVVVFDDATELIKAQRDAAWGDVARRLAHEIKNPLTPIQLSAERIRRKYLDKVADQDREPLDRATRTIANQVESMKSMVDAFSEYAQPVVSRPVQIDINTLVRDITELHLSHSKKIEFDLFLGEQLPMVMCDPSGLRQVLNNLIINAADALTGSPGLVQIHTRRVVNRKSFLELEIRDNGPGFAENLLDRIFDPYVTTKTKGSGLGLAISRRIVEENGGLIRVGNLPGGGATAIIHIPTSDSQDMPATDPPAKE
ncbi:MAG TPA: ATP-binding protein [Arenicellales bacterium]|jgi:nitrogen fixation/metabolism regulation signal transduction histidine kinase|nr:ATP-binding protein [Arenicellales bacterium]MDP7221250.1 ATP-binding protein [Arenicellales bacterium]HJP09829.1 ATP-binding protein [Arenicellales bacterium]|tara:strand:+ start:47792 stop:49996 length:2205 start_codon:yes stop_codon:yes gene_type:complete